MLEVWVNHDQISTWVCKSDYAFHILAMHGVSNLGSGLLIQAYSLSQLPHRVWYVIQESDRGLFATDSKRLYFDLLLH